jgi:hypothetical protein
MKKISLVLSVALVASFAGMISFWIRFNDAQRQIGDLDALLDATRSERSAASSFATPEALLVNSTKRPSSSDRVDSVSPDQSISAKGNSQGLQAVLLSPENQAIHRAFISAQTPRKYPGVAEALGLSTEARDRFLELLARQDSNRLIEASTLGTGGESAIREYARHLEEKDGELATYLGGKYEEWLDYKRELPIRRQIEDLKVVLGAEGISIGEQQAKSLVSTLSAARQRVSQELASGVQANAPRPDSAERTREMNAKLVDAASTYLNPRQLELYTEMLDRKEAGERRFAPTRGQSETKTVSPRIE